MNLQMKDFQAMRAAMKEEYDKKTPEEQAKFRETTAKALAQQKAKFEPFLKATKMGFTLSEDDHQHNLNWNGQHVATGFMSSYHSDNGDYYYYEALQAYVNGTNVGVRGKLCEVGADRPGMSYHGEEAYILGTLDGDNFIHKEAEERDLELGK